MVDKRRNYSASEKAKVALEACSGRYTTSQLSSRYGIHSSVIARWVSILKSRLPDLYKDQRSREVKEKEDLIETLYKKVGQQNIELDWLKKKSEGLDSR